MEGQKITSEQSLNDSGIFQDELNDSLMLQPEIEKEALTNLNNRLARYIEYNQKKQNYYDSIRNLEELIEIPQHQLDNLRSLYSEEIHNLRNALDQQSNRLAQLTVENSTLNSANNEMRSQITEETENIRKLNLMLNDYKVENLDLKLKIEILEKNSKTESDYKKQLLECQRQLEYEVLLRTSAENACLTYKEKMEFNESVFKKELGALMHLHQSKFDQVEKLKSVELSSKIVDQLDLAREKLQATLQQVKDNLNHDLLDRIDRSAESLLKAIDRTVEIRSVNCNLELEKANLVLDIQRLKASHIKLEDQLSDLMSNCGDEIESLRRDRDNLREMRTNELSKKLKELNNVRDSFFGKLLLDSEISTYRKLLESEENRTNHSFVDDHVNITAKRRKIDLDSRKPNAGNNSSIRNQKPNRPIIRPKRHNKNCILM